MALAAVHAIAAFKHHFIDKQFDLDPHVVGPA